MKSEDVVCVIKNSATLAGSLFTLHASQIHIDLPTLSNEDKQASNKISCTSVDIYMLSMSPAAISKMF